MTLQVIGAGYGRTGTLSLKKAIEILGLGRCHHMAEVIDDRKQIASWLEALELTQSQRNKVFWDRMMSGYVAAVDWPSILYYKELSEIYPEAKVILTIRPFEEWYKSMQGTILELVESLRNVPGDSGSSAIVKRYISELTFKNRYNEKEYLESAYYNHIRTVKSTIASNRLLEFDVAQGWEPLCNFLQKDVPDIPFPFLNRTIDFRKHYLPLGMRSLFVVLRLRNRVAGFNISRALNQFL